MIIFMSEKDFLKNKKMLVEPKEYVVGDATDDTSGELHKFNHAISLDGLKPPKGLVNILAKKSDEFDPDKLKKLEKRYTKSPEFRNAAVGLVLALAKSDKNYFIVFKNKDFKVYGARIIKAFEKLFKTETKIFFDLDEVKDKKKILRNTLSASEKADIEHSTKKVIKKIEESEEVTKKKKKDKDKDKDKKKDKKKKDKFLF